MLVLWVVPILSISNLSISHKRASSLGSVTRRRPASFQNQRWMTNLLADHPCLIYELWDFTEKEVVCEGAFVVEWAPGMTRGGWEILSMLRAKLLQTLIVGIQRPMEKKRDRAAWRRVGLESLAAEFLLQRLGEDVRRCRWPGWSDSRAQLL